MKERYCSRSSWGSLALVTALSAGSLYGCNPTLECGPGTVLEVNEEGVSECRADQIVCDPGTQFDVTTGTCITLQPCAGVTCNDVQRPPGVAGFSPEAQGNACVCQVTACEANYDLQAGGCIENRECPAGYGNEGGICVPIEGASCYDQPASPICIPTNCEDQPTAADGTDLVAAGKCVNAPPPGPESCTDGCHNGIEDPHPWYGGDDLTCTGCHGGDPAASTRETAHIALPAEWQAGSPQWGRPNLRYYWNYYSLAGVENFTGGLEWLRFRNPSDLRIAEQSCGKNSGCHQDRVENVRRGVMSTSVGLLGVSQQRDGFGRTVIRGQDAVYKWDTSQGMTLGWAELQAVDYESKPYYAQYTGAVQRLAKFSTNDRELNGAYDQLGMLKETYAKQCGDCHLQNAGANRRYAEFRTSGCGACHMQYSLDGRSKSYDQMINKNEPTYPAAYAQIANYDFNDLQNLNGNFLNTERAHPAYHRLTRQMASQRCGTCHVGSNRTDWQFRGYQIDPNRSAVAAIDNNVLNANNFRFTDEIDNNANAFARYHGQAQDQVLKYADWNNDLRNDIPADVHFQGGMECMDCHTSDEMHNELKFVKVAKVEDWNDPNQVEDMSGAIWSHMDQSTQIECTSCHGNLEYRAMPYEVDNRNPAKNLIVCPELGETIPDYTVPAECATLGRGRFMRSKFTTDIKYVPQTADTVYDIGQGVGGGITRPDNGAPVYSLNASIFHGRFNQDLSDGAGPCPNGNIQNCFKDQQNAQFPVTQNFSHLGEAGRNPSDQMAGGLECYACHATWANMCFGCHLRLIDNDGNNILRQGDPTSGEITMGFIAEADFTAIAPQDLQYGINSEGKIAQFLPETKQFVAHTDYQNNEYFGTVVLLNNDANIIYNSYAGYGKYGMRQYNTEAVGIALNSDGILYEQFAEMDNNAGQGHQPMMPHTVQRSRVEMDCEFCHVNFDAANENAVLARWGAGANGFANVSAYLQVVADSGGITRNNSNEVYVADFNAGWLFDANTDPQGFSVASQTDWLVEINTGFPYIYSNKLIMQGREGLYLNPQYTRAYPRMAVTTGPLNQNLLFKMFNEIIVANEGVQDRDIR